MYRLILVDDEVLIREAISENLDWNSLGLELAGCFQHGGEAMEFIRNHPVDIVLTDIAMPFVDGLELSRMIYEEYKDIHIIILSGYDNFEYAKKAIKYKVEEYLLKPVTPSELVKVLAGVVAKVDKERKENQAYDIAKKTYQKNRLLLKSQTLLNLVYGKQPYEKLKYDIEQYGVNLDFKYFCVAILEITRNGQENMEDNLVGFIVYNVADEILKNYEAGEAFRGNNNNILILFTARKRLELMSQLDDILEEIQLEIGKILEVVLTVGVGDFVEDIDSIPQSSSQAKGALAYKYLLGQGEIIFWSDSQQGGNLPGAQGRNGEIIEKLCTAFKTNEKEHIEECVDQLREDIRSAYVRKEHVILEVQSILLKIRSILDISQMQESEVHRNLEVMMEDISSYDYMDDTLNQLEELLTAGAEEMDSYKDSKGKKRAVAAIDYIEKNYMNPELSLQSVCDFMALSPSRFSAMLKEATGSTFMEILIKIRMDKAKELLANTDMKNYEIAEKVGFTDPHYFSISFKKIVGMTPKEYAKGIKNV